MTAEEALHAVQDALEARGLPGGVGLRHRDRCFIVGLRPADRKAAPAIAGLLTSMGCEVSVNGFVYGHLAGKLLPAPPPPSVPVRSADSCQAAEGAAVTVVTGKRCNGPCGEVKPLEEFSWRNQAKGWRCSYCRACESVRLGQLYRERKTAASR